MRRCRLAAWAGIAVGCHSHVPARADTTPLREPPMSTGLVPPRLRPLFWIGVGCLFLFLGIVVYQKLAVGHFRYLANQDLLAELRQAVFLESAQAPGGWPQWRG